MCLAIFTELDEHQIEALDLGSSPPPKAKEGTGRLADDTNAGILEDQHLREINPLNFEPKP